MIKTWLFEISDQASEILKLLIEAGAELNAETDWGDTAVHYAAIDGTLDSLSFLIESGIKISKTNMDIMEGIKICKEHGLSEVYDSFISIFIFYIHLGPKSFTSLKEVLCQKISCVVVFCRCLLLLFPWTKLH